jgi:hypothetical protein
MEPEPTWSPGIGAFGEAIISQLQGYSGMALQ